jgi:hypothetical protein
MKRIFTLLLFCLLTVPQGVLAAAVVLFDEGHGQRFHVHGDGQLDLSSLAERFSTAGFEVRTTVQSLDVEPLDRVDVLVISGAFRPLSGKELAVVQAFLNRGGNVAVMLHIAPPVAGLLEILNIDYANGILHDGGHAIDDNPKNFRVSALAKHPLTAGLTDFAVYGCWALRGAAPTVEPVAWTTVHGWVDLSPDGRFGSGDVAGAFAVAATGTSGSGRYVVFGDDALFQNRFLDGSNRLLADNLARWLSPGETPGQMEPKLQ